MAKLTVEIESSNIMDASKRKKALDKLQKHASTEALQVLERLVVKDGISEKLVSKEKLISQFI